LSLVLFITGTCNYEGVFQSGVEYWKPDYPSGCLDENPHKPWLCLFGNYSFPHHTTPTFVIQNLFDYTQLDTDGAGVLHGFDQEAAVEYALACKDLFHEYSIPVINFGFFPSCYGHNNLAASNDGWVTTVVHGHSLRSVIDIWFETYISETQIYWDDCEGYACNPTCVGEAI